MTETGMLIVFSGPSGVGKGSVLKQFLPEHPQCVLSVSTTTRAPRPGEEEGVHYYFTTQERFDLLAAQGRMLEYASFDGHSYGTPQDAVDHQLAQGKHVILEIDVQGARQVRKLRPDCVSIFLMPPSWQSLEARLQGRGTQTPASLQKRLEAARLEISGAPEYDYVLINHENSLDQCCKDLEAVIIAAGYASGRMTNFIQEVSSHA